MDNSSETNLVHNNSIESFSPMSVGTSTEVSITGLAGDNANQVHYQTYRRRWIGMSVIIGLNISTGFVWMTFNSVSTIAEKWLNASIPEVNLSSVLYFMGSIVMSSFSGYVFETWGIKTALIVGGSLNVIGTWIRYFGSFIESTEDAYQARLVVILIGQFIAACAQPFFLNVAPKYSAVWFSDSSRAIATTIGTVCNPVGVAIAMVVVPAICSDLDGGDMQLTLLVIGIIAIVALAPAFFMPIAPPTPPSASAEIALAEAKDESFLVALKKVSSNTQFWILFTAFSVFVAIFNSITSLINQIVVPYGYSDDDAGLFGASFIGVGIVGAAVSGIYVDRTKNYKEMLKIAAPFLALGYVALVFVVREDFFVWICLVCAALGFVSFALLPVALELGVECTYPCPPSTSTSVLWMGGQSAAVVFLLIGTYALRDKSPFKDEPKDTMTTALICVAAVAAVTTLLAFFFNSPYYRMEAEKEAERVKNLKQESSNQNTSDDRS